MNQEPEKPWLYHAIIDVGDAEGVHRRVSMYADSLDDAKKAFEGEHGEGAVGL